MSLLQEGHITSCKPPFWRDGTPGIADVSLFMPILRAQEIFAEMNEPVLKEIASMDQCTIFSFSHYLPRQDIPDTLGERC